ncbi:TAXI family TRAP transporter solute-binding subunit [Desulfobacterales bacterium HSG2]|nr:TAXI family TRAP transporter solute-binding subunit [Desulfobacterales bacterium HSG2]
MKFQKFISFFAVLIIFCASGYPADAAERDDSKITMATVIYSLQVLTGMKSDIPTPLTVNVIGTGDIDGVYYPMGGAIASVVNSSYNVHGNRCVVESTLGSVFNVNAVLNNDLEFGIAQSDTQYDAVHGLAEWDTAGPRHDLRALFSLHPESVILIAADDANINSIKDLSGKKVNIGHTGSGYHQNAVDALEAFGIDYETDLTATEEELTEAFKLIQDGDIDAFFYTVGHPSSVIAAVLADRRNVHIVPISGPEIDDLIQTKPYYSKTVIPINLYPGATNTTDVETFGLKATFVTSARVSEETVYEITKEVFENFDTLISMVPAAQGLTAENMLEGSSAPVHNGAMKYYQEAGLQTQPSEDEPEIIGTGSVSGLYYPTGGAIARLVNADSDQHGVRCSVESTGGSSFNINAVTDGYLQFGIAQSDRQHEAANGLAEWQESGPQDDLRAVFSLHPESVTLIAADEHITTVTDLKGRRVNIGNIGSGTRQNSIDALNAFGINYETDITAHSESVTEASELLQAGTIDAFFYTVGHPNSAVVLVTNGERKVHFVPIEGPEIDSLVETSEYYTKSVISIESYPEAVNFSDVATFGVKATFVTSADVSENTVYTVTKQIFDNFDAFKEMHPAYRYLQKEDMLKGLSAPIHKGAMKYYQEAGLTTK